MAVTDHPLRRTASRLDAACMGQLPSSKTCGNRETLVLAHRNLPGEFGMALKGPDWWGAILCHDCHAYGDGPVGRKDCEFWERAVFRTMKWWIEQGDVIVPGR